MKKSLATFVSSVLLSFSLIAIVVGQETISNQSQDSGKPDVALKITSKPRVSLDPRCRERGEGTVTLRVTFDVSKKVMDVSIIRKSSCSYFDQDAIKAAKRIKFEPALKNGQPMTTTKMLEYSFRIY